MSFYKLRRSCKAFLSLGRADEFAILSVFRVSILLALIRCNSQVREAAESEITYSF